jgi:methionyl-tRNA synthetase
MEKKTFYISTPLYYVNDVPHIGHAYSTIGADVLARFKKACGEKVFLLTGTDEHGQKVAKAAEEKGMASPKAFADSIVVHFKKAWEVLGIRYDRFFRTTDEDHYAAAKEFFLRVQKAGYIEKRSYEGWYCVYEETFHLEKDLGAGNTCPECGRPATRMQEENYFFTQSRLAEGLKAFLQEHPDFIQPETRRNEVLGSYLNAEGGVQDISITRSSVKWGIPVPGDEKQVLYVWFDALINYLTATGWPKEGYEKLWPADVHIIGKEILRFHAVLWPSMLKAAGLEVPTKVFGTGWIVNDGKKMSKSLGNVIDPIDWAERFGSDVVRYYLLRDVPFGLDASVSEAGLKSRYDTELADVYGNLLSRTLTIIEKQPGKKLPAGSGSAAASEFRQHAAEFKAKYLTHMERLEFHLALEALFALLRQANRYIDEKAPWKLAKDPSAEAQALMIQVLAEMHETLRVASLALLPFMPGKAKAALEHLGYPVASIAEDSSLQGRTLQDELAWDEKRAAGVEVSKGQPLFPKAAKVPSAV